MAGPVKARAAAMAATVTLAAPAATSADQTVQPPAKRSLGRPIRIHRRRHHHRHRRHHHAARRPWNGPVIASWYYDAGSTACGFHARYGFASLFLPCGARIQLRGPAGVVTAVNQDRGPYIAGRTFDLNPSLRAALGCSDLCDVTWRPAG